MSLSAESLENQFQNGLQPTADTLAKELSRGAVKIFTIFLQHQVKMGCLIIFYKDCLCNANMLGG